MHLTQSSKTSSMTQNQVTLPAKLKPFLFKLGTLPTVNAFQGKLKANNASSTDVFKRV